MAFLAGAVGGLFGGGGSSSKATQTVETKSAVDVMTRNIMNCSSNTFGVQEFIVSGSYNKISNVKQVQALTLSATCSQENKDITNLQAAVANELTTAASAHSQALLGVLGGSKTQIDQNIKNEVSQKISKETVANIVNTVNATQRAIISGDNNIIDNFSQEQTMSLVFDACQKALSQLTAVQAIENAAKGKAEATQANPIADTISATFSGMQGMMIIFAIVAVAAIIFLGKDLIKGGPLAELMKGDDTPQQPTYQPMPQPMYQPMPQSMPQNLQQAGFV
jgi:hypothetical protein